MDCDDVAERAPEKADPDLRPTGEAGSATPLADDVPTTPGMLYLVRVTALAGYTAVAERVGLDPAPLLKAAGLSPAILANPEQLIPAQACNTLLEESARRSGCPTFGLRMGLERKLTDMGMVSVLMALQPTLAAALQVMDRCRNRILPIIVIHFERHGDIAVITLDLSLPSPEPHRQGNDLLLSASMLICKAILGQDWVPHCAYFTYPEPQPIDRMLYSQRFGPSLQFNADFNGFATSVADLDRVRAGADPALLRHAETLVDLALGPAEMTFSRTVRQALMHLLGSSEATLASTAAALGLHPRTLQRHLQDEGVSFRTLVNQTRMQLAVRLLANPAARIADVADALGYSSTGAFSRWHRQAFGRPPTHQR